VEGGGRERSRKGHLARTEIRKLERVRNSERTVRDGLLSKMGGEVDSGTKSQVKASSRKVSHTGGQKTQERMLRHEIHPCRLSIEEKGEATVSPRSVTEEKRRNPNLLSEVEIPLQEQSIKGEEF